MVSAALQGLRILTPQEGYEMGRALRQQQAEQIQAVALSTEIINGVREIGAAGFAKELAASGSFELGTCNKLALLKQIRTYARDSESDLRPAISVFANMAVDLDSEKAKIALVTTQCIAIALSSAIERTARFPWQKVSLENLLATDEKLKTDLATIDTKLRESTGSVSPKTPVTPNGIDEDGWIRL